MKQTVALGNWSGCLLFHQLQLSKPVGLPDAPVRIKTNFSQPPIFEAAIVVRRHAGSVKRDGVTVNVRPILFIRDF